MEFKLTVLGTASAMPVTERKQSAQVLQVHGRFFLIDCGEGTQTQLLLSHIPSMKIDTLLISHIHGDHIFGLFPLLSTLGMKKRTAPLNVYAPSSFGPVLKFFLSYFGEGISYDIRFTPLNMKQPQVIYQTKKIAIEAFPLEHKIETFGFIVREKEPDLNIDKDALEKFHFTLEEIGTLKRGEDVVRDDEKLIIPASEVTYRPFKPRSYAYCSDTSVFPEEADWVKGVDLLYHEATYLNELEDQAASRHHSTAAQAATVAREAGVGKLVLGHYSSRCRDKSLYEAEARAIFPESYAADDLDVFEVPLEKLR